MKKSNTHYHICPKCNRQIDCRAIDCEYPRWVECSDCVGRVRGVWDRGSLEDYDERDR